MQGACWCAHPHVKARAVLRHMRVVVFPAVSVFDVNIRHVIVVMLIAGHIRPNAKAYVLRKIRLSCSSGR